MGSGAEMKQSAVTIGESHIVTLPVTNGQNVANGGSGGARTRYEPNNEAAKTVSPSQTASQKQVTAGHDLSQVVTAWAKLPAALKAAILAIVRTADGRIEGAD